MSISMPRHKTELISIQTITTSHFRPSDKNKNNFDPYAEIKSISTTHTKTMSIDPYTKIKLVIFGPHTKTESISIHTLNPSNFGPHTKRMSILTPAKKTSQFRCPLHKNQVNFDLDSKPSHFRPHTKLSQVRSSTLKSC